MKTKSFYARVEFTDERGVHPAGSVVNLPYESDRHVADALSMVAYGVLAEQAPPQPVAPAKAPEPALPMAESGPMVSTPGVTPDDPQTPWWDARREDGDFASKEEAAKVTTHDHAVPEEKPQQAAPKKATRRRK